MKPCVARTANYVGSVATDACARVKLGNRRDADEALHALRVQDLHADALAGGA